MTSFSERYGLSLPDAEITVRDGAPSELREAIPQICYKLGMRPTDLRSIICETFLKAPDTGSNWSDPNVDSEVRYLLRDCEWFEVYDAIEALSAVFHRGHFQSEAGPGSAPFTDLINRVFRRDGIGWQLVQDRIEVRGGEAFEIAIHEARSLLRQERPTAANELHQAILDLSRRPTPEITGAIQHAMAALECVARGKGHNTETLGSIIKHNPQLFPKPIDTVVEKAWGWASNHGRHLQEGDAPGFEEAELIVGISGVLCRYLGRRL
jgi:AbiJ N-terminal domain 4